MKSTLNLTCKNCENRFTGKYCNNCGEKVYNEHDKSVFHILEEAFHFITHFEGKLFRTIKTIFKTPGELSVKYANGVRKPYFKPISLFFFLVILYLLFPVFEGLNMKLHYHMEHNFYGGYASKKVERILATSLLTYEDLAKIFHQKGEKVSKFLLFIIIPLAALFFWLCTFRKRRYFFDQMVFSAEVNSFYLLWSFLLMPVFVTIVQFFSKSLSGSYLVIRDPHTSVFSAIVLIIFVIIGSRRYYNIKRWQAVVLSMAFWVIHSIIVQIIYKCILFYLVIEQID